MKKLFLFIAFTLLTLTCITAQSQEPDANVAYKDHSTRFTVITDGVIRMEWAPDGRFTDNRSFVAVNRTYPRADYKVRLSGSMVEITTAKMTMKYKKGGGKFTADNLSVTSAKGMLPFRWKPGMKQQGNLKGTYRTLDAYEADQYYYKQDLAPGEDPAMPIEDGLLATDGWTLVDDSRGLLFDNSDWPWVEQRPDTTVQDWYFMAYGHDYKTALKDFTVFAGKTPLPPRYAFGYWWSRYWCYTDNELRNLVRNFRLHDIPLDVMVIDMDWHYTNPGRGGWTGFTWNEGLFPDPAGLLSDLDREGMQVTLNLHPADGVAYFEKQYPEMARWMGVNPDPAAKDTIKWAGSDKRFMSGWYNTVLRPLEKMGVDFWWLDWQQELNDSRIPTLSNTWWLNYTTFTDMQRNRSARPLLYHRWGGLGNHRYQIGFSGDAVSSWKSLDFQTWFNATASNVLYGYWSHDIGGFYSDSIHHSINPELLTRWAQFGAVSPIMRTHAMKDGNLDKEPWKFDRKYFEALRNTVLLRYRLVPYIYTMARKAYDTGLSLCRPMYYDYPESKEAYGFRNEYMFGDRMLVAPVVTPMEEGYSTLDVWLPAGDDWYEWHTGALLKGGQTVRRSFAIDEYPLYFKAGSIIPTYANARNLRPNDEPVELIVFPGGNGTFEMYEDNGNDKGYEQDFAVTALTSVRNGNTLTVTVGARKGSYPGMSETRNFTLKVPASAFPESVVVNGEAVSYRYDGDELALVVDIPTVDCSKEKVVGISYPANAMNLTDGLAGKFRRIRNAVYELKYRWAGTQLNDELSKMESINRELTSYPERLAPAIERFRENYGNLPAILDNQVTWSWRGTADISAEDQEWFLKFIRYNK